MSKIQIYTLGFTRKDARTFFRLLKESDVRTLIDVRLNNVSQLAGFTKRDDLKYFLEELVGAAYLHAPDMAPTKEILDGYKKKKLSWEKYEKEFCTLLRDRRVENLLNEDVLQKACFMCSEPTPEHCHRRLVAEYLAEHFQNIDIKHL